MATADPLDPPRRQRRENALLALFRIPVFRRMWAAIAFSSLGDWLGLLANTALAQQLTREQSKATQGAAIAAVILVRLAPDLLFGAFAAAFADKWDRRKTVIIGQLIAATLYASIAFGYNLIWLYVAQFVIEAAGLFTQPAMQVIWVGIVPKKHLATANQVSLISVYGSVLPAVVVFALLSATNRLIGGQHSVAPGTVNVAIVIALLLNTVTFLVAASTVFLSRHDIPVVPAKHEREQGIFSLIREGVSFVRHEPLIRGLYVGIIGAFAAGGLTAGVAQLWVATLSAGNAGYAIMFGTVFTGLAVGMLVGPRILPSFTRTRVFGLAIGSAGIALLIMSLIGNFILAVGLAACVGAFAGMAWIIGYTLIGAEVEDRLRGRIFAFVLSSVRLMLLATIAAGPVLAGGLGSHEIKVGQDSYLRFSGPGLTLLLGGIVALLVSLYATSRTSRSSRSSTRLRDLVRSRIVRAGLRRYPHHTGLFVTVDGLNATATAAYTALVTEALRARSLVVSDTTEPTDSPTGRRVGELLRAASTTDSGIEPETAALLSAADRAEHVAAVIRPALERGEVVVCDRFFLTSLALHGGGRGADIDRVRAVNTWGTGGLLPDLTLVVEPPAPAGSPVDPAGDPSADAPADAPGDAPADAPADPSGDAPADATAAPGVAAPPATTEHTIPSGAGHHGDDDVDLDAARRTLLDEADADPNRYVICPADAPLELPAPIRDRLSRLIETRASLIAATHSSPGTSAR